MRTLFALLALCASLSASAGALVDVAWLQKNLGNDEILLIDTSPAKAHA